MPSSILRFKNTSHYYNGFKTEVARLGFQDPAGVVIGLSKFSSSYNKLLSYLPFSTLSDWNSILQPSTTFAGSVDSIVHIERTLSVFGALSRTFSIPSVSGPSYKVCNYHIERHLSGPPSELDSEKTKFQMVVIAPKVAIGDCIVHKMISQCNYRTIPKTDVSSLNCRKGLVSCCSARMDLKNSDWSNRAPIFGYLIYNALKSSNKLNIHSWFESKELRNLSGSIVGAETYLDGIFPSSLPDYQPENVTVSANGKVTSDTRLKLLSGSCCLPHPDKEESGGEDAHFICPEEQAIGVADGVGGWAELGVDAGEYARELMSNAVSAVREEPKGSIDPARVLEKAHSITKVKGSSTACIIALTDQGLHAINLGDSGFIVVRDGQTVFCSPVQQHDFNFTFQLECGDVGDLPSSGQVFSVPVAPGDVIIAGTDGLFDNLYNNEVCGVVVNALKSGLGPQLTAQKIADLARQRAHDRDRPTPFSIAAQDAGFRYYGGKLDDITVVVSYITNCIKEDNSSPPIHGSS